MWIKRRKQLDSGISKLGEGTANTLDYVENTVNSLGDVPVVGTASERMRKRVTGYTNPLKRMIRRKKKKS